MKSILTAIILLALPTLFAVMILIYNAKAARTRDGQLAVLMAAIDALGIGAVIFFFSVFEFKGYNIALNIGIGVAVEMFLIAWMTNRLNRKTVPVLACLLALLIGGRVGTAVYNQYVESIRVRDRMEIAHYRPFQKDSLVKTLEEPAALKLTENLPRMDGATALYPVYAAFAQAVYPDYTQDMPVKAYVQCSTTSSAYDNIVHGDTDIIFVASPSAEQEAYAKEKGVELVYTPIGREAFVFFVNPKNPLDSLTLSQIRGIYSGQITRWDELNVKGLGNIQAFQRSEGSGSQTALLRLMGETPLMDAPTEKRMGGMLDVVEAAADYKNFKNAIGYSFRFYCTEMVKDIEVKLLAVEGVSPTVENIENGTYPIASYFYAVTRADADENTLALLDWICGPQGQALIEKTGYIPAANKVQKEETP